MDTIRKFQFQFHISFPHYIYSGISIACFGLTLIEMDAVHETGLEIEMDAVQKFQFQFHVSVSHYIYQLHFNPSAGTRFGLHAVGVREPARIHEMEIKPSPLINPSACIPSTPYQNRRRRRTYEPQTQVLVEEGGTTLDKTYNKTETDMATGMAQP